MVISYVRDYSITTTSETNPSIKLEMLMPQRMLAS